MRINRILILCQWISIALLCRTAQCDDPKSPPEHPVLIISNPCQCPLIVYIRAHTSTKPWTRLALNGADSVSDDLYSDDTFDIVLFQCVNDNAWKQFGAKDVPLRKIISENKSPEKTKLKFWFWRDVFFDPQSKTWSKRIDTDKKFVDVDVLLMPYQYEIQIPDLLRKPTDDPYPPLPKPNPARSAPNIFDGSAPAPPPPST